VTALSLAIGYVATLGFAAYLLWRHDRYRTAVRDQIVSALQRIAVLEHRKKAWDAAADYVEAKQVEKGIRGIGR
jgi:hypothetical protein